MNRVRMIIGVVAIAGFAYLGLGAFKDSLNPYVTFAEARTSGGKTVQVSGDLPESKLYWYSEDEARNFHFYMVEAETGDSLEVVLDGVKPATFEEATGVVAIGTFDGSLFQAKQILTKCPSKYEGKDPSEHERDFGRDPPAASALSIQHRNYGAVY